MTIHPPPAHSSLFTRLRGQIHQGAWWCWDAWKTTEQPGKGFIAATVLVCLAAIGLAIVPWILDPEGSAVKQQAMQQRTREWQQERAADKLARLTQRQAMFAAQARTFLDRLNTPADGEILCHWTTQDGRQICFAGIKGLPVKLLCTEQAGCIVASTSPPADDTLEIILPLLFR